MSKLFTIVALLAVAAVVSTQALTVHLVCHTHDDVGWLKTVDQYYMGLNNSVQHAGVQYVLDSVVLALSQNPARRFSYVEQAFFQRWWRQQNDDTRALVKTLVANKQLEFINGGWCMHDEAAAHYVDMVDQTTLGHKFINTQFGVQPTIGWQIDPFGHSATQAALLSAEAGFDGLFFGRIDYQDHTVRLGAQNLEFLWRASASLGPTAQVFTGAFQSGNYGPPDGFCFDWFCSDLPIQDDPRLEDYNVESRVQDFVNSALNQAAGTRGDVSTMNIMWTLGSDFMHENSNEWFKNLDKLIKAVNADGRVTAMYSTPSTYVAAKNAEKVQWTVKTDDFFPYADGPDSYWTGYFTSRPALKRYIRQTSAFLQVARHMEIFAGLAGNDTEILWEAQGVAQHHDAVSGTSKQHVAYDYARRLARGAAYADSIVESTLSLLTLNGGMPGPAPALAYCPLSNVSICDITQSLSSAAKNMVAIVYNPQDRARNHIVSVPLTSQNYAVVDQTGASVPVTILPTFQTSAINPKTAAQYTAYFPTSLPALGFNTYFLTSTSQPSHSMHTMSEDQTTISNDFWTLQFDSTSGLLTSATSSLTKQTYPLTTDFAWYPAYQVNNDQDDGAYIFRPNQDWAFPLSQAKISFFSTPGVVVEARQTFASWLYQTIRLYQGQNIIEFEWTVGSVPIDDNIGKNVVIRFNSSVKSAGVWFTDSNGREFQQRTRNARPTWKWDPTQPVAGNYYPVNTGAWLADKNSALVINNDRSQGVASLVDGELEFMIHRRLLVDDGRGVSEPLNETAGITGPDGQRIGPGLVITGKHYLNLTALEGAAAASRFTQDAVFQPPHVSFGLLSQSVKDYVGSHTTDLSYSNQDLPINIEVMTAQVWGPTSTLIRLSHQFGVGEDAVYSAPVTLDLTKLFKFPSTPSIVEYSLTANQLAGNHKPLTWNTTSLATDAYLRTPLQASTVTINPLEIRTFLFQY